MGDTARSGYRWRFFSGLALAVSPRAGIPVLTLFLMLGITTLGVMPFWRHFGLFFGGGLIVLLPTFIIALPYGLEPYVFWVYKFSALILPVSSPVPGIITIVKAAFPVALLTLAGFFRGFHLSEFRQRRSVWILGALAVTNFIGLWSCRHPYMQHFLMTFPFLGFFAGLGYDQLIGSWPARRWLPGRCSGTG